MTNIKLGTKVKIIAVNPPLRQPKPEHVGKFGEIVGIRTVRFGQNSRYEYPVPVIRLEDGSEIHGTECWWIDAESAKEAEGWASEAAEDREK